MARYFTSDLHIGHARICELAGRPYGSVDDMNEDLVRRWNALVGPEDEVFIIGDLCMGRLDESLVYVGELNGHKSLVPGNHDRMFDCTGQKYINTASRYIEAGIETILPEQIGVSIAGMPYLVCHFPYQGDSGDHTEDRYQDKRPSDRGMSLIHGHCHGKYLKRGRMIDVGVDAWGGSPVEEHMLAEAFAESGDLESRLWVAA